MIEIHTARHVPPIDWKGVPANFKGKVSAVCRTAQECDELVTWFGDSEFCPLLPIMIMVPGLQAPTLIAGLGYATAAELRDCAVVTWHEQLEKLTAGNDIVDFDDLRERHGLMRREDVDPAFREASYRRIAQHKANPVTDPFRQPVRRNPTHRNLYQKE
jgi:hypothetical protein